jgi:hypothetical protein
MDVAILLGLRLLRASDTISLEAIGDTTAGGERGRDPGPYRKRQHTALPSCVYTQKLSDGTIFRIPFCWTRICRYSLASPAS